MHKPITLFLVAFMAFGGSASALSTNGLKIWEGSPCSASYANQVVQNIPTFDLTYVPTTAILLAGNPSGTIGLIPFWGHVDIAVKHADQSLATMRISYAYTSGNYCFGNQGLFNPVDISPLFMAGPNFVQITLMGNYYTPTGLYAFWSPTAYLVSPNGQFLTTK